MATHLGSGLVGGGRGGWSGLLDAGAGYGVPVRFGPRLTAPLWVRVLAMVGASLVLGLAAHATGSGMVPGPGALVVVVELVTVVVAGLVAGGRWAAGGVRRWGWAARVEDGSAVVALVVGQALVHWLATPGATAGVSPGQGHVHAGGPISPRTAAVHLTEHAGHGSGWGMLVGHAGAAVAVGLLLRWLEAGILGLAHLLACVAASVLVSRMVLALTGGWWVLPGDSAGLSADPMPTGDRRRRLQVLLQPVERRGPPHEGVFA